MANNLFCVTSPWHCNNNHCYQPTPNPGPNVLKTPGMLIIKNDATFSVFPLISFNPPGEAEQFQDAFEVPAGHTKSYQIPAKYSTTIPAQGVSGRCYLFYNNPHRPSGDESQPGLTEPFQLTEFTFQYESDGITPRMNFNISCVDSIGLPVSMHCGNANVSMSETVENYKNITVQTNPTVTFPDPTTTHISSVNSFKTMSAFNYFIFGPTEDRTKLTAPYVDYYANNINQFNPQTQDTTYIGTMVTVFGQLPSITDSMVNSYVFGGNPPTPQDNKWYDCVAALNRGVVYNDRGNVNMFYTTTEYPLNSYAKFIHVTLGFPVYSFPNDDHQQQGGFKVGHDYTLLITAAPLG